MTTTMLLGSAKRNITPLHTVPLAGYAHRSGYFERVAHPLYLRIMVLRTVASPTDVSDAILVSADLIWWGAKMTARCLSAIEARFGVPASSVILSATHTHSGPQTSEGFVSSLGEPDQRYLADLEQSLLLGIEQAYLDLETVTLKRGIGHCSMGVHRRKIVDGKVEMLPNEVIPVDDRIHVVQFSTTAGDTKAVLSHYACHPTTTDRNEVSSEFPGVAMEMLEQRLGAGVTSFYLQGCCGDVRPMLVRDGEFYRGDDTDVVRLGEQLAIAIERVLDHGMRKIVPCSLFSRSLTVELPLQQMPSISQLRESLQEEGVKAEWARLLLDVPSRMRPTVALRMNRIQLAEGLALLAMNGEIVSTYGFYVREHWGDDMLPIAYCNGMIGYIPSSAQIAEGGYEADESHYYFGVPSVYDCSVEERIKQAIKALAGREQGS